jgi:hypothetical protein
VVWLVDDRRSGSPLPPPLAAREGLVGSKSTTIQLQLSDDPRLVVCACGVRVRGGKSGSRTGLDDVRHAGY